MDFLLFDFAPDVPGVPAVIPNSVAVALQLGYNGVDETDISTLFVYHDEKLVLEFDVGEKSWRSAIFVEAWLDYRGYEDLVEFQVDQVFLLALEAYMGEGVWADAVNPALNNHVFLRAIRSAGDRRVKIEVEFQLPEDEESSD